MAKVYKKGIIRECSDKVAKKLKQSKGYVDYTPKSKKPAPKK